MMDLIFTHKQEKTRRKGTTQEDCLIELFDRGSTLLLRTMYTFTYLKYEGNGQRPTRFVEVSYTFSIEKSNGNFMITNHILTEGTGVPTDQLKPKRFKNKFDRLAEFTSHGLYSGGKKNSEGQWGVAYNKKVESVVKIMTEILQPNIKNQFLKNKGYEKVEIDPLYDFIVDYFCDKKKIKGHDLIYTHIQEGIPKPTFLKNNDGKFVPAILEEYGIKTNNFIGSLNEIGGTQINIRSLRYISKLFGDNYIDYMNKIDWEYHCFKSPPTNRLHELKTEREKKCMVELFKSWGSTTDEILNFDSLLLSVYHLLELRNKLEDKGVDLKFDSKTSEELESLREEWESLKKYFSRGFKLRYVFPEEFIQFIESDIQIGNVTYQPIILKTEEEFKVEGHIMKNCMANQFSHGVISIYVSLRKGKKWVDVQYRKGEKKMCFGKANSPIPDDFKMAVNVLDKRFSKIKGVSWIKEKYDLIFNE